MRRSLAVSHATFQRLPAFESLSALLGRSHAERETRWMAEHVVAATTGSTTSAAVSAAASRAVATRGLDALNHSQVERLAAMVQARSQREPLQYLLGEVSFLRLPLRTRAPVLIPRPETETMVAWVLARWQRRDYRATHEHLSVHGPGDFQQQMEWMKPTTAEELGEYRKTKQPDSALPSSGTTPTAPSSASPLRVLDLCSGSGNIALSLFHHLPLPAHVLGCDISSQALQLARDNLHQLSRRALWHGPAPSARSQREGGSIEFAHVDLLHKADEESSPPLPSLPSSSPLLDALLHPPSFVSALSSVSATPMHRVNLIVSNPPYIPVREYSDLQAEVRDWEDYRALISGDEGMDVHEAIIRAAPTLLYSRKMQLMSNLAGAASTLGAALQDTSSWDVPELVFELGSAAQVVHLSALLHEHGFEHVTIHHDLAGLPRFIAAAREKHVPKAERR